MELKIDNSTMENLIKTEVKVRIAEVLAQKSDVLVREVVRKAFEEKRENWGRETVIESTLNTMVRAEADAAMKDWIEQVKPQIRKLMLEKLNDKKLGLVKVVTEKMIGGLQNNLDLRVFLGRSE